MHRCADIALRLGDELPLEHLIANRYETARWRANMLLQGQHKLLWKRSDSDRPGIRECLFVRQMDAAVEMPQPALATVEERSKT